MFSKIIKFFKNEEYDDKDLELITADDANQNVRDSLTKKEKEYIKYLDGRYKYINRQIYKKSIKGEKKIKVELNTFKNNTISTRRLVDEYIANQLKERGFFVSYGTESYGSYYYAKLLITWD